MKLSLKYLHWTLNRDCLRHLEFLVYQPVMKLTMLSLTYRKRQQLQVYSGTGGRMSQPYWTMCVLQGPVWQLRLLSRAALCCCSIKNPNLHTGHDRPQSTNQTLDKRANKRHLLVTSSKSPAMQKLRPGLNIATLG